MTDTSNEHAGADQRSLFVTDAELIRRLGVGEKTARVAISELERRSGFPKKDKLFGDKRYWPAVVEYLNRRYGIGGIIPTPTPQDGCEYRPLPDGMMKVRYPDGTEKIVPDGGRFGRRRVVKRELKPRTL